jgi:hypothetical protein
MAISKQISSDGFGPFSPNNRRLALPFLFLFFLLPQILPKDKKTDGTQIMNDILLQKTCIAHAFKVHTSFALSL